ncbi:MAG: DUF2029 domain-containing protein [Lachnospiraceae bacterium]|nr:DUF2029 domain-containing protein [Lachnospiraceae bacterium]
MTGFERGLRKALYERRYVLFIILVSICAVIVRVCLWDIVSSDMSVYVRWHGRIAECGGIPGLHIAGKKIKGYNALFQLLTAVLIYIPGDTVRKFKALWMVFDFLLAGSAAVFVSDIRTGKDKSRKEEGLRAGLMTYALSLFSMPVIFNSSVWGQSDSVYVSFILLSLVFLFREKFIRAFIMLGIAFAFKLQTVFIMPFFLFYYVHEKKFSLLHFFIVPGMLFASALPRTVIGIFSPLKAEAAEKLSYGVTHKPSGGGVIGVYLNQIFGGGQLYMEYPSFWAFLPGTPAGEDGFMDYYKFRIVAVCFTVAVLACLVLWLYRHPAVLKGKNAVYAAFLTSFATVFFLPCMIDRYGYIYEMLALVLAVLDPLTIPCAAALHLVSCFLYAGRVGAETSPFSLQFTSVVLLVLFGAYLIIAEKRFGEVKDACL